MNVLAIHDLKHLLCFIVHVNALLRNKVNQIRAQ